MNRMTVQLDLIAATRDNYTHGSEYSSNTTGSDFPSLVYARR